MKNLTPAEPFAETTAELCAESTSVEGELTGLPWPKTWKGAYLFVLGSFILWLGLLVALTEYSA
jgi:hypothetical protein